MQDKESLEALLRSAVSTKNSLPEQERKPLLVKLSPELTDQERRDIAGVLCKPQCRVDGLIISNTTTQRPEGISSEQGGLSGRPLAQPSTQLIRDMYKLTKGQFVIVGKSTQLSLSGSPRYNNQTLFDAL